jgi:nucleotidyltransferase/DNA polymerase involved in DNA repair
MQMRTIAHLDADAFFASVEQAADARLRGKPIAVGGESRGIIASASYEARKFGVYTPMPTSRARKLCPKLIVLPGDYERYEDFSNWMFAYAYDFTPDVERTSIDEGYFDLTANHQKPAVEIAQIIRKAIAQKLKISVSQGIGANKLISQIASKLNKPAAFLDVPHGGEINFLHPLPNKWLPGVGPKTSMRLNAAGLADIGQVAGTPLELLGLMLGGQAPLIRQFANGIDERPIVVESEPQKSFSKQETFAEDVTDEDYVEAVLRRMPARRKSNCRRWQNTNASKRCLAMAGQHRSWLRHEGEGRNKPITCRPFRANPRNGNPPKRFEILIAEHLFFPFLITVLRQRQVERLHQMRFGLGYEDTDGKVMPNHSCSFCFNEQDISLRTGSKSSTSKTVHLPGTPEAGVDIPCADEID